MKMILKHTMLVLITLVSIQVLAQDTKSAKNAKSKKTKSAKIVTPKPPKEPKAPRILPDYSKMDFSKRTSDHLMLQIGSANWAKADGINFKGLSRTFNAYFLFDFPFKTNPRYSVAVGPGIGTDNIFFDRTTVDLNDRFGARIFTDTITKYRKNKLVTGYVEVPIEIRYSTKPENMNKGWKFALGLKVGTMVDGKVKSKVDLDATNTGGYISKEKDKRYFNSTRLAATARVGIGNISLFGTYTITDFFKEGLGPLVRPYSVGLTLSGL